ncbi:MAG: aminopeptidase P family protein [Fimbriimonadaceae bacterium]|nr:aminopeptidase P family protein [Fimbriimonadaceae bacterium]
MNNVDRLRERMADAGVDALLLSHVPNVQWLTGFTGSAGSVLLTETDGVFMTDSRYTLQAAEEVSDLPVRTFANPVRQADFLAKNAHDLGLTRVGFEREFVTYGAYQDWQRAFAEIELYPAEDLVASLRAVKSADEIAKIRRACALTDACLEHVVRLIQPGVREWDVLMEIEFFFRRQGADKAFEPIVVSGERSARPHGHASDKTLAVGDFVTLDLGAMVDGFCGDVTRTFVVGEATDRHREIYAQVLRAEQECCAALLPGANGKDVDALARRILDEKDLARYFGHGLGHGLGRLVHDSGRLGPTSDQPIEVGQVWTVEPGVYIEGFGGVRIEDDVLVTESGPEILTHFDRELLVLPR